MLQCEVASCLIVVEWWQIMSSLGATKPVTFDVTKAGSGILFRKDVEHEGLPDGIQAYLGLVDELAIYAHALVLVALFGATDGFEVGKM